MRWVIIIIDPDDKKVKIDWFYLKKIVFDIIRENQFLYIYISLLNLVTSPALVPTVFFSRFFDPLP